MIEKRIPTSEKVNSLIKFAKVYFGVDEKTGVILWTGTGTTLAGTATFYLTDNGLEAGSAIFTSVFSIQALAENPPPAAPISASPAGDAGQVPLAGVGSLSADLKTLTIEVIYVASPKSIFAPDGTKVYVTVIGD
ncbi:hypothetical protein ES703_113281 [subsurface metagenome]